MNWKGISIAYRPYHPASNVPGDRRRFVFYAKERGVDYSIADISKHYDIVYLTYGCDIAAWLKYKRNNPRTKIIFELIDSYLAEDAGLFTLFRGSIRYITKKESKLFFDYKKALRRMVSASDAVVCSTPLQQEMIGRYNRNVHVSLDYFSEDITHHKANFESAGKLKLVWEGQAYTARNLLVINEAFETLKEEVELHIITDPEIKYPFKFFNKKTDDVLKTIKCPYHLHQWDRKTFSTIITEADLAIIPIPEQENLMWNKPENKLLLLWETGIPVFTSPTPAYKRVMTNAGFDGLCERTEDWVIRIREYAGKTAEERKQLMSAATRYLDERHSKDSIIKNWDAIFASVMDQGAAKTSSKPKLSII